MTLILTSGMVVTRAQLRFPKRLDLSIPQYKGISAENSGPQVLDNNTLENFCVDVSVFSPLKFKETKRERFSLEIKFESFGYILAAVVSRSSSSPVKRSGSRFVWR